MYFLSNWYILGLLCLSVGYLLKSLQQLVLASPLYGIYQNPDFDTDMPPRLPLMAFDTRHVDERLDLNAARDAMAQIERNGGLTAPTTDKTDAPNN